MKTKPTERLHRIQSYLWCEWCGARAFFSHATFGADEIGYDARFCAVCDVWLERGCSSEDCCFCGPRPARPSEVPYRVRVVGQPWPEVVFPLPRTRRVLELEARADEEEEDLAG